MTHDNMWEKLFSENSIWINRLEEERVYYAIPLKILDELSNQIAKQEYESEKLFTEICAKFNAVGVVRRKLVLCGYMTRKSSKNIALSEFEHARLGWGKELSPETFATHAVDYEDYGASINRRMTAYAGWLLTNPVFIKERDQLRAMFTNQKDLPQFPLKNDPPSNVNDFNIELQAFCIKWGLDPVAAKDIRCKMKNLFENTLRTGRKLKNKIAVCSFLARWGLSGMATWELPLPQGPVDGGPADIIAGLINMPDTVGRTLFVPYWYEIINSKDDILLRLRGEQTAQGNLKIGEYEPRTYKGNGWPIAHHDVFCNIFYTLFYSDAVRQRWDFKKGSRFSGAVVKGIARFFGKTSSSNVHAKKKGLTSAETASVRGYLSYIDALLQGKVPRKLQHKST